MSGSRSVIFKGKAAATVQQLADDAGVTFAETVRRAVAREAWFRKTRDAGEKILVEGKDGRLREIEFVR